MGTGPEQWESGSGDWVDAKTSNAWSRELRIEEAERGEAVWGMGSEWNFARGVFNSSRNDTAKMIVASAGRRKGFGTAVFVAERKLRASVEYGNKSSMERIS